MRFAYRAGLALLIVVVSAAVGRASEDGEIWITAQKAFSPHGDGPVGTDTQGNRDCIPLWLETTDYFVDITSTLPNHSGQAASIEVRRVRPIYQTGRCRREIRSAILVHGRTIDGISAFDVPYKDYSIMTAMANNGIDAFAFNQLGFGASSHFSMDDPCNASLSTDPPVNVNPSNQQKTLLVPNPLAAECPHTDSSHFTDRQAGIDQLDAIVNHVRSLARDDAEDQDSTTDPRRRLSLFSWSLGSTVVGPYLATLGKQANIDRVVILAGPFGTTPALTEFEPPPGVGRATWPLGLGNFTGLSALIQLNAACPGQRDPDVLHAIWDSMRSRDPYAAGWGSNLDPVTGGLSRWPTAVRWGWGPAQAAQITVPTLVIGGTIDLTVPPSHLDNLYEALASAQKVRVQMDCASHASLWEGSTNASGWGGPHTIIQEAIIEWLTNGTYLGYSTGRFRTLADGTVVFD
jgi:pimeloyl-ACP methyl ester carboxylesterase